MDSEYMKNFNEMLNVLEISPKDLRAGALTVPLYRSLYIDEMMEAHNELVERRDESFVKLIEKFDNIKSMNFVPPVEVSNVLRKYQKEGFLYTLILLKASLPSTFPYLFNLSIPETFSS